LEGGGKKVRRGDGNGRIDGVIEGDEGVSLIGD
jgi:hypothetical protein